MEHIKTISIGPVGTPDPVSGKVLSVSNADSNLPADPSNVEFIFPGGFLRWTLVITPRNNDTNTPAPTTPTVDVKYWTGRDYQTTNPATGATATRNKANTITREDAITKILVGVRAGATPVDGGVDIALFGTRVSQ